jgi:hypothetical protein
MNGRGRTLWHMASEDDKDGGGLSSGARLGLVLGAVAVLLAAFFIARGGDDEGEPAPAQTQATTTQERDVTTPDHGDQSREEESETQTQEQPATEPLRTVRVQGGQPVGGVKTLTYRNGDRVRLRVVADAADEVHVHGFDIEREVGPSEPARFDFEADIEGRFEVELHNTETQIAEIEVRPAS